MIHTYNPCIQKDGEVKTSLGNTTKQSQKERERINMDYIQSLPVIEEQKQEDPGTLLLMKLVLAKHSTYTQRKCILPLMNIDIKVPTIKMTSSGIYRHAQKIAYHDHMGLILRTQGSSHIQNTIYKTQRVNGLRKKTASQVSVVQVTLLSGAWA